MNVMQSTLYKIEGKFLRIIVCCFGCYQAAAHVLNKQTDDL